MVWKRFENTVKISSAPAETVAFLVPHDPGNEQHIDSVEALGPNKLRPGFRNVEISRRKLFPEVFELREEKVNVSFLHNGNKNSLVAIQGFPNERTSVNLASLADVASNTDRKSTRLNSSHLVISYAVFCLKKKKKKIPSRIYNQELRTESETAN